MSTTTIRLDDELKSRLADAATRAGKTPHAFIVDTLADELARSEWDAEFQVVAEQRWAQLAAGGKSLSLDEAQAHLTRRVAAAAKATVRKRA